MKERVKKNIMNNIAGSGFIPGVIRIKLYNLMGMDLKNKTFGSGCYFSGNKLTVGKGTWINFKCAFENHIASVEIGNNCAIAMEVLFCTTSHTMQQDENIRAGFEIHLPIKIEDGCWIGARATILQGVTVKKGCVIAAGSIVTKDCEPNGLYAGVPARRIKELG